MSPGQAVVLVLVRGDAVVKAVLIVVIAGIINVVVFKPLLVAVGLVEFFDLLGYRGCFCGRLEGRRLGAATFGPIVPITFGLEPNGPIVCLLPTLLGCPFSVETAEEGLLASRLLPGRRLLMLCLQGPACCRFEHAAVGLGSASGVPTGRYETKVVGNFELPGAFLPCFFSAHVALANAPTAPPSPSFVWRDGLMRVGVTGAMILFYLIWLVHGGFWVKKRGPRKVLFRGFWKGERLILVGYQFLPSSTRTICFSLVSF